MFEKVNIIRLTFDSENILDANIIKVQGFRVIEGTDIAQLMKDLDYKKERVYIYKKLSVYEHFLDVFNSKIKKD